MIVDLDYSKILYVKPGEYTDSEKRYLSQLQDECDAIAARGDVNVDDLISGKLNGQPGVEQQVVTITAERAKYYAKLYDPDNPLYNDSEYAKAAGYQDIQAMPGFGYNDHRFMFKIPPAMRDVMVVSGLYHEVTFHQPQYPGDSIYCVRDRQEFSDISPKDGAHFRTFYLQDWGRAFNQKGELVLEVYDRVRESCANYANHEAVPDGPDMVQVSWKDTRPRHYYTDADWDMIRDIWSKETRRGAEPLYWEDVQIGDEPTWTIEGPNLKTPMPDDYWGMGTGDISISHRKHIMASNNFEGMTRDEITGIWHLPEEEIHEDRRPPEARQNEFNPNDDNRDLVINYLGRDFIIRHINNYIGEKGRIYKLCWGIMPYVKYFEGEIPDYPDPIRHLDKVPYMKGKISETHGLLEDIGICKSYVCNKYEEDGRHYAEIVWWLETIDGYIWEDGSCIVILPSKND